MISIILPSENVIVKTMLKPLIAIMSSIEAAAIHRVGTP